MKLLAVNGRKWTADLIYRAIEAANKSNSPIDLLVENAEFIHAMHIEYTQGARFPHLVRDETRPDLLTEILQPRTLEPSPVAGPETLERP